MGWAGLVVIPNPIHAAPTELDAAYRTRGYKHGAPNGAFYPQWLRPYLHLEFLLQFLLPSTILLWSR